MGWKLRKKLRKIGCGCTVHAAAAFPIWVSCKSHTGVQILFASPEKCKLQGCLQLLPKQSARTLSAASFPYQKADSVSHTAERFHRIRECSGLEESLKIREL